jgi:hypothetical protein
MACSRRRVRSASGRCLIAVKYPEHAYMALLVWGDIMGLRRKGAATPTVRGSRINKDLLFCQRFLGLCGWALQRNVGLRIGMNTLCHADLGRRHPPDVAVLGIHCDQRPLINAYLIGQNHVVSSVIRISETIGIIEMLEYAQECRVIW